ncbi:TRAP transporter large permease subunit [Psychromarinibacter sp. C21-152]|uniref:TRAP transporter large permease protein n=1 Tax=Psychromarinibacter sediminicola TaxID=3033385 RepID=A0AAE3T7R7_9RHOB|nr:TRAP transporter large permease subunit [Psychromarinibacter sediminicola]MDF0599304.1 TRAP transporter large permease subunit [Psychromarinibacter sediminicola]
MLSPEIAGLIGFIILFGLIALRMPIAFAMGIVGFGGFWYMTSWTAVTNRMASVVFELLSNFTFGVLPLFLLMAQVTFKSGIGKDLYDLAARWLGHRPGGLAMATVFGCAGFAAVSASSIATAATFGLVALPEMKRYKYSPKLATGCIAAGGTIGSLIPPSGILIIYGILTESSIGKLFLAGLIPGILEAFVYVMVIALMCWRDPKLGPPAPKASMRERLRAFLKVGEITLLIVLVLGGLMIGWFTPTEAAAIGSGGAILITVLRGRLSWPQFRDAVVSTLTTSGFIFTILIMAFMLNGFVALTNIPYAITDFVQSLAFPAWGVVLVIMVIYFFLGMVLDTAGMMALTVPIFFPIVQALGVDPIWFGILVVRAMEVAMITPPIGITVYVMSGIAPDVPLTTIFKGIIPFVIADLIHIALLFMFPMIVLFLVTL